MTDEEIERARKEMDAWVEAKCTQHERLAASYRKAVWQPWLRLAINEPQEPEE